MNMNRLIISLIFCLVGFANGAVSSSPVRVSEVASLKALAAGAYPAVQIMGYRTQGDSGGFVAHWDAASTSSPDSCSIFKPTNGPTKGRWIRDQDGKPLSARSCGAYGDGTHDDYVYLTAWKAASKSLYLPRGRYRHTQTLRWTVKGQQLTGEGSYSAFFPDVGASADGHVFGDSATGVNNLLIRNVAFFCDSTCRDAVVMLGVFRSRFENVFVNGSISYDVYIRGALTNYFNLIISKNVTYPYPSGGFNNLNGLIRIGPRLPIPGMGGVATNANYFDVTLEGGAFAAGSEASYFQETQDFEGDNTIFGTIQGMSGPAIQVNTSTSFHVTSLHGEASGRIILNNCKNAVIGPGWRTEQLNIQDFTSGTLVIGTEIYGANLIIGANCTYTTLIGLTYTAGATLVDSSTTTTRIGNPSYSRFPTGVQVGAATPTFATKSITAIGTDFDGTSFQMENTDVGTAANGRLFNLGITDVSSTEGRMDFTIPSALTAGSIFKSGNWGLGSTTDGGEKIQVTGTSRFTGLATFTDTIVAGGNIRAANRIRAGTSSPSYATKRFTAIGNSFDNTAFQSENTDVTLDTDGRMFNWGITDVSATEGRFDLAMPGVLTALSVFKSGNLGIGSTTDGGEKLQVTGAARITGAFAAYDNITLATAAKGVIYQAGPKDLAGSGTPEGAVTAPIGSTYRRSDGGAGTSFYVKESGTGNTGWVGK